MVTSKEIVKRPKLHSRLSLVHKKGCILKPYVTQTGANITICEECRGLTAIECVWCGGVRTLHHPHATKEQLDNGIG